DQIESVVLVGGGVRVPFVQTTLKTFAGSKLAQNLNQDEALVLGAGLRAAALSPQFRVREAKIRDFSADAMEIVYEMDGKGMLNLRGKVELMMVGSSPGKLLHTTIFGSNSALGTKKLMNFQRTSDFNLSVSSKSSGRAFLVANISGLTDAAQKYATKESPAVKVQVELTESGTISLSDATAVFEIDQAKAESPTLADTVLNFFGGGKKKEAEEDETEDGPPPEEVKTPEKSNNTAKSDSTKKVVTEKVKLNLSVKYLEGLAATDKAASRTKLDQMDAQDAARRAREEAVNSLEAFIYQCKDFIYTDEVENVTTEEQRESFLAKVAEAQDWLDDDGTTAKLEDLRKKLQGLKSEHSPILRRRDELRRRPAAVEELRNATVTYSQLVTALKLNVTVGASEGGPLPPASFTDEEADRVLKSISDTADWLDEMEAAQARLKPHEPPVLLAKDIEAKKTAVANEVMRLLTRPRKPVTSTKKSTTSSSSSSSTTSSSSASTSATETDESETPSPTPTATEETEPATTPTTHDEL
ncbi:Hypoxia up-regulated protein 1, partial [Cladochytrium tenue]